MERARGGPPPPEDARPAIEVRGVVRTHRVGILLRPRTALAGVDLEAPAGAVLGLLGPNGSGKSSLLRILAGVDRPTTGTVRVLGGSPLAAEVRARVAFLPEDSPFPPELDARANLALVAALAGLPRREARPRAEALLERVGLAQAASVPLARYSRGMKRRFGLAQAWLAEPELLLLDEPTAGLDAPGFAVLEDLLAEARGRGATVVLSSHLASDLLERADRVALLLGGRVAGAGTPADVLGRPGVLRLEVAGLDEAALAELERWVAEAGGRVLAAGPAERSLVELFRDG